MPRPEQKTITLTIDDREIEAVEGTMLVDAAKQGDIEIPYFCYEPKLGNPVGACRMCLVEVEGIPKLQTSCSTPVKDGMVVRTQTDRVRHAQNAVVEFLLVNHPLDCPVCDKGGECPLQDITFGWGLGRSRFIEPKRHFVKPLALSPLVAIDRERCILCYRCVRFSQEISEDYQLIFAERGAHSFVTTHNGHPYVAPFSGNITDLCPVGALTSQTYRFRARPWDIESGGSVCTLCSAQCNVNFTVRDEKVMRVVPRENPDVEDGWICDKGRYAYQAMHVDERITRPLVRDGGQLREVSWERALQTAAGLARHKGHVGALIGGRASNEEGFLLGRLMREGLGSSDIDSRLGGESLPLGLMRALAAPGLQATVSDLEYAHTVLLVGCEPIDEASVWDLRIRKGVRRRGVNLVIATDRPSALDAGAKQVLRYAPGEEAAFLGRLEQALSGESAPQELAELSSLLSTGGEDVVIVYGERLGAAALRSLLRIAGRLNLAGREGAGLLELPGGANARGLREVGAVPGAGPGYAELSPGSAGRGAASLASATAAGEVHALILHTVDPVRDLPDSRLWDQALHRAGLVVSFASVLTPGLREHASVIFPAESHAEKEGTLVHPDGRVQRMRQAIKLPGDVRPGWWVIAELMKAAELDPGALTSGMVFRQIARSVPFFEGLTLDEIGGLGVNWTARPAAGALPAGEVPDPAPPAGEAAPPPDRVAGAPVLAPGHLRLGRYRPIWAAPEVEISPALKFTVARQVVEIAPADARRLGIRPRDQVVVSQNGTSVRGEAHVRTGVPEGTVFLATGVAGDSANLLGDEGVILERVGDPLTASPLGGEATAPAAGVSAR